ncbi:MAG: hypothetical protein Ct9H300mP1_11100 [Planctomycetaceae bacterium]|nr:MAG: hypothetical protein Ct9H300mP1_11100 [Planctomycetaceae bacterium]
MKIAANARKASRVGAPDVQLRRRFRRQQPSARPALPQSPGQSVYVRPNEDIEVQVSKLYDRIGAPMLTKLAVNFEFDQAARAGAPHPIPKGPTPAN